MVNTPSHDWIQNNENITIIFYIKDIAPESILVDCTDTTCNITFKSLDILYEKKFENLRHSISYLTHNLTPNKLELIFKKSKTGHWNTLFKVDQSNQKSKDKDKKFEFSDSEPENSEDSFMNLLKDIYNKGDDQTKRAMIKSFQTSGGKVLSTNWNSVKDNN